MVRGALFKRIEEEKGLGGWAPAPRRGIRTVGITDSAISNPGELVERLLAHHARQAEAAARPPAPAPGYRPEVLQELFGSGYGQRQETQR